jgi:hypothetical protein
MSAVMGQSYRSEQQLTARMEIRREAVLRASYALGGESFGNVNRDLSQGQA